MKADLETVVPSALRRLRSQVVAAALVRPRAGGRQGGGPPSLTTRDPIYVPVTVDHDRRVWTHVGMRFKGNSSLMATNMSGNGKIPFRLDFDRYEAEFPEIRNQRFYGFQKLTFSSNFGDDSQIREVLATEIFRDRGVPAPRAAFYRVFVDTGEGPAVLGPVFDDRRPRGRRDAGRTVRHSTRKPVQAGGPWRGLDALRRGRLCQEDERTGRRLRRREESHRCASRAARRRRRVARRPRSGIRRRSVPPLAGGQFHHRELGCVWSDGAQLLPVRRSLTGRAAALDSLGQQFRVRNGSRLSRWSRALRRTSAWRSAARRCGVSSSFRRPGHADAPSVRIGHGHPASPGRRAVAADSARPCRRGLRGALP